MQYNCKKGLCLAFLFSAMFLTGWEIAGMRSRQTKETAAVAYEAGNWGLGFGAEGTRQLFEPFAPPGYEPDFVQRFLGVYALGKVAPHTG